MNVFTVIFDPIQYTYNPSLLLNIKYHPYWNIVCPITSDYATNNSCINLNICAA